MAVSLPPNPLVERLFQKVAQSLVDEALKPSGVEGAPGAQPAEAPKAQPPAGYYADSFESAPVGPSARPQLQVPPPPDLIGAPGGAQPMNDAAGKLSSQGWSGDAGLTPQDSPTSCGEANLIQVSTAAQGADGLSPEQAERAIAQGAARINGSAALGDRVDVNLKNGTTADEMGALLGEQGQRVVRGFDNYDAGFMNDALQKGQFGLALVDSNAIRNSNLPPDQRTNEPGALHWVTIDGVDNGGTPDDATDDKYRVKDPVNGEYWISEKDLKGAVEKARGNTGSGGVLVVENDRRATTPQAREALALENLNHTGILGKGDGIGSKRNSAIESS